MYNNYCCIIQYGGEGGEEGEFIYELAQCFYKL